MSAAASSAWRLHARTALRAGLVGLVWGLLGLATYVHEEMEEGEGVVWREVLPIVPVFVAALACF